MLLFSLLIFFYYIGVCDPDAEVYRISYGVVRLTILARRIWVRGVTIDTTVSCLYLQLFIIPALIFLAPGTFRLLGLGHVDLIPLHLVLVAELLFFLSRLSSLLLFHLILKKASQHIFFLVHPVNSLLLVLHHSFLEFIDLSPLKVISMLLPVSVADSSLVFIDVVESVLVIHDLVVVLLVDRIFLGLKLVPQQHLLVVLAFLPLPLILFSTSHVFPHGYLFMSNPFLLLQLLPLPDVILFHALTVEVVHPLLLLNHPPFFLASLSLLLITELKVLPTQLALVLVLIDLHGSHLSLHILMVVDRILKVPPLLQKSLMPLLQLHNLRPVIIVSECRLKYLTILLLSSPISVLVE